MEWGTIMNKAILMSIQPAWLVKILNGEKTIEIRKTMPKCELPIDVYLYCTKDNKLQWLNGCLPIEWGQGERNERLLDKTMNGKVVAKFTLNKIDEYEHLDNGYDFSKFVCSKTNDIVFDDYRPTQFELKSCLEYNDIITYAWNKKYGELSNINNIYAWHIDNLVIFDKPKELSEFEKEEYAVMPNGVFPCYQPLTKAPKSWQYVYVKGE